MTTSMIRGRAGYAVVAAIGLLAGAAAGALTGYFAGGGSGGSGSTCDTQSVAHETIPSLVTVQLATGGVGSGEFVRSGGYIVTNNHVISSAPGGRGISVLLTSGQTLPAQLVGRDPGTDLAVLKVAETDAPVIGLGDSTSLALGQPLVALGSPLGLSGTVTAGIVSALGRRVPVPSDHGTTAELVDAIQTDASINPGNSGGALVDCQGRLVGINTAIATVPNESGQGGGGSVGIGFAVPVALALPIVDSLIAHGSVPAAADLGIVVSAIPPAAAQEFGVQPGLFVHQVSAGGLAAKAGLRAGDVITEVDGKSASSADVLATAVESAAPGETIALTYVRSGQTHTASITVGGSS